MVYSNLRRRESWLYILPLIYGIDGRYGLPFLILLANVVSVCKRVVKALIHEEAVTVCVRIIEEDLLPIRHAGLLPVSR